LPAPLRLLRLCLQPLGHRLSRLWSKTRPWRLAHRPRSTSLRALFCKSFILKLVLIEIAIESELRLSKVLDSENICDVKSTVLFFFLVSAMHCTVSLNYTIYLHSAPFPTPRTSRLCSAASLRSPRTSM
jgi:hypothetical protein